jgi:hypothetical protein
MADILRSRSVRRAVWRAPRIPNCVARKPRGQVPAGHLQVSRGGAPVHYRPEVDPSVAIVSIEALARALFAGIDRFFVDLFKGQDTRGARGSTVPGPYFPERSGCTDVGTVPGLRGAVRSAYVQHSRGLQPGAQRDSQRSEAQTELHGARRALANFEISIELQSSGGFRPGRIRGDDRVLGLRK